MEVFLLLSYGNVFTQTKTKYETAVISTGHASLSAEIIKNGSALEVWVKNNHPTKTYKVNFTANIRLGGTKGEIDKIHRPKREKVLPNVLSKEEIKKMNEAYGKGTLSLNYSINFNEKVTDTENTISASTYQNIGYFYLKKIYNQLALPQFFNEVAKNKKITFFMRPIKIKYVI